MERRKFLGGWGATAVLVAQEQNSTTFVAGTTQVRLDVLVANGKGPVSGLKREDFVVYDEGQVVELRYAGTGEEELNILMLLDVSGSMRTYLEQIGKRARGILDLLQERDKVGVMVFSKDTDYFRPFTPDKARAALAIDQALLPSELPSGTAINAALVDAAGAFAEAKVLRGYRSVMILTDNRCLNYRVSDDLVIERLFGEDVVLNAIVTKNAEPPKVARGSNPDFSFADVFRLAEATGGEVLRTDKADEAFGQLLANMRKRYLLGYVAPGMGAGKSYRKLRVELSKDAQKRNGKVTVRARAGYYTKG